jgi:gliding motility-associated-like protein
MLMKKTLSFLFIFFSIIEGQYLYAQTIQLVPNPDPSKGGYEGSSIIYDNKLYVIYQDAVGVSQLAQYDSSNNTLNLIPNPGAGIGSLKCLMVYNNKLYIQYENANYIGQLAQFDGTSLTLIANPDAGSVGINNPSPILYNGNLYFQYINQNHVFQLAQFDGTTIKLIPNPDATSNPSSGYSGTPCIYNNKLCISYLNKAGVYQLAVFDGTAVSLVPNPDATTIANSGYQVFNYTPVVYNNKLYIDYLNASGTYQLAQYDGSSLTLIPNPDSSPNGAYYNKTPIVYNNKIYFQYINASNIIQLASYDGNVIKLIPNPDAGYTYFNIDFPFCPIIYNSNLYFEYTNTSGVNQLADYDGNVIKLVPNPDNSIYGYDGGDILFNNKIYSIYTNASDIGQLAQYDGNTLMLITNPDASTAGFGTAVSMASIIYANQLYNSYYSASNTNQLSYLVDCSSTIPSISIASNVPTSICTGTPITFTATSINGGTSPLYQWQKNGINVGTNDSIYIDELPNNNDSITCILTCNNNCTTAVITDTSNSIKISIGGVKTPYAYVANVVNNTISVINTVTNITTSIIPVSIYPLGVYPSPDGSKIYVTNRSNFINVISTGSNTVESDIPVGYRCWYVCASPDGSKLYATAEGSDTLTIINTLTNTVITSIKVGEAPRAICVSLDGSKAYVLNFGSNTVSVINTATNMVSAILPVGINPFNVAISPDGSKVYVTNFNGKSVSVINTSNNTIIATVSVGYGPACVCVSPDGSKVYVGNSGENTISIINTASNIVTATILMGKVSTSGIGISPDGTQLYISNYNTNNADIINTATNQITDSIIDAGGSSLITGNNLSIANVGISCPPIVISFNPTIVCGNKDTVTISGRNFAGATFVSFGDVPASFFTVVNDSTIKALTSTGASGNIIVTTSDGTATLSGFIYNTPLIPSISIAVNPISPICSGTKETFTATSANEGTAPLYQWQLNGINVGANNTTYTNSSLANGDTIRCIITSNAICTTGVDTSHSIVMQVNPVITPSTTITTPSTTICSGNQVTFTAIPTNGGTSPLYQWQLNGINIDANSNSFVSNTLVNKDNITCILTSDAACLSTPTVTSNDITITVPPTIIPSVSIAASTKNICFGNPITFTATPTKGGNTPSYQWKNNGNLVGSNSSTYISNSLQNNDMISCVLTSSIGCTIPVTSDNTIAMVIYPLPIVTDGTDKTIQLGTSTSLDIPVTGNIASYLWTPSDGLDNPYTENPIASPNTNTVYQLQVTSVNGCTASGEVKVDVFSNLLMPNSFTPNGDGKNDIFRIPPSISVKIKYFVIYDRWGNQVFSTSDGTSGWDGTYQGAEQPSGAYVWILEYIDPLKNDLKQLKGTVMLVR